MAAEHTLDGVPLSTLHPKYLYSNSTSHTWPFGAIAELIDNAYDSDVDAKQIWIDKTQIKDQDCLTFMDNGHGLCYDTVHQMLSFGYSNKKAVDDKQPIGMYGNGFKSGSMRLGNDVIILSRSKKDLCVGMLSQSYLKKIGATEIFVPIISIKDPRGNTFHVSKEHMASQRDILRYSLFSTKEELLNEFEAITSSSGTRIIIWNLRRTERSMELDFTTDDDICISSDVHVDGDDLESDVHESDVHDSEETEPRPVPGRSDSSIPESDVSLRAYCSILYMKPSMQINIRGKKVEPRLISKSLGYIQKYTFNPKRYNQTLHITFGVTMKNKEQYGIMMYYKNRLIKAYERIGCQKNANSMQGVIGVIECNHLNPTHNKQDFDHTDKYRNTIANMATKLRNYGRELQYRKKNNTPSDYVPPENTETQRQQPAAKRQKRSSDESGSGAHMDLRSRNPPTAEGAYSSLPQMNLNEKEEQIEDLKIQLKKSSDEVEQLKLKVKQLEEEKDNLIAENTREKEEKRRQEEKETAMPKTPQTPRGGASACSPATSSGHPVISSVYSLSKTSPSLKKRLPPTTTQSEVKQQRRGSVRRRLASMSEPLTFHEDANNDHNLLEGSSTSPGNGAVEEMRDQSTQMKAPQVKDEEEMNISTAAYGEAEVTEEGRLTMAQEQQRQLIEMLQSVTYKEEVCYKEEVEELHAKVMELKEKQCADRETQEGEAREAREKIEELSKEKEALLEAKSSLLQQIQEQAKQIKDFTCRADQSSNEIKNLHSKVKQLEEEKANISAEFEKNQSSLLQQIQEQAKQMKDLTCRADQSSNEIKNLHLKVKQLEEEKASISAEFEKNKSSLMELRSKVASLLN